MIAKLYSYDFTTWYILNYGEMLLYIHGILIYVNILKERKKRKENNISDTKL